MAEEYQDNSGNDYGAQVVTEKKVALKKPNMYRVVMLNDDYTPMDFVVWVLQKIFFKSKEESTLLMLEVHTKGRGVCGVYTYDVARTKVAQVKLLAEKHEHPLQCVLEVVEAE